MNKLYLFATAEILNNPRGAWFCKTVIRVWTWAPSLAPPVGLNKVQTKCSSISGSVSNTAEMRRAWKQNQKMKLLDYSISATYIQTDLLNIFDNKIICFEKHHFFSILILILMICNSYPTISSYHFQDFQCRVIWHRVSKNKFHDI